MPAVLAVLAATLWGTGDYLGGILSRRVPSLAVVFVGQCAALFAVGGLALVFHPPLGAEMLDGIAAGALGAIALVTFYAAMARSSMSLIAPLSASGIAIPVLWALAHGTPANLLQGAGMLLAFTGAILAGGPERRRAPDTVRVTMLLTVVAAVCFGVYYIFVAQGAHISVLGTVLWQRATAVVLLAYPAVRSMRAHSGLIRGLRSRLSPPLLILLPLSGLAEGSANGVYGLATNWPDANLAVVTILVSLYPVMTTLLACFVLKERLRLVQNIGISAALAGVLLLNA